VAVDPDLNVADFDFELPSDLIAQEPITPRDASRMLVLSRNTGGLTHAAVRDLADYLRPGDLLVANNSRVLPARFWVRKVDTGAKIELLLLRAIGDGRWEALGKPAKKLGPGSRLEVVNRVSSAPLGEYVDVLERREYGQIVISFEGLAEQHLDQFGVMPLPPYIHHQLEDPSRYQTLYASVPGSAAAPTAGLHLTPELREACLERGADWAEVTLHIGLDTFRPVTVDRVADHQIHTEWCSVGDDVAMKIAHTKLTGGRVFAIGTTSARTLESLGQRIDFERPEGFSAPTAIFITPGYKWTIVDAMLTNFHLPRSTLIMMISAFAGRERVLSAYRAAIEARYRFFSFGDAMLIV
jgi:S-adenosylmethionine:tRNA ribosyltransferase-isomerase